MHEGQKIRKIREMRGYTQEYVASQLEICTKWYGKIENGRAPLSYSRLQQVAEILEVDVVEILNFSEKNLLGVSKHFSDSTSTDQHLTEKERELYERTIKNQKEEITLLRGLIKLRIAGI